MKVICNFLFYSFLAVLMFSGNAHAESYSEYVKRGNSFYKEGNYGDSVIAYKEAIKVAGKNVNVYYNLGLAYKKLKNYPEALKTFEKFLRLAKKDNKMVSRAKRIIRRIAPAISKPTTSGKLKNYEVWEGWILVNGDVIVPEGVVLKIKPGALVMFSPLSSNYDEKTPYLKKEESDQLCSLIVRGTLIAEGKKGNEILFSNSYENMSTKKIGLWGGIVFEGSKGSVLKNVKIERAKNGVIFSDSPNVVFKNNVFMKNEIGVRLTDSAVETLDDSIFYRNETGISIKSASKAVISNANFTKNSYGIKIYESAKPEIKLSTFNDNSCGIGTYGKAFPKITENTFKNGKFGISLTDNSKALIQDNSFLANKIGIFSVNTSSPRIYGNTFSDNTLSAIKTVDESSAKIDTNTFKGNNVGITKVKTVNILGNTYEDNNEDIKDVD